MMIERKSHIRKFLSAACAVMMVLLCGCSPKATDAKTVVTGTVNGLKYSWYEGIALFGPNFARGWYFHDEKILICDGIQGSGGHGLQVDSIGYDSSTDTVTITVVSTTDPNAAPIDACTYPHCYVEFDKLPKHIIVEKRSDLDFKFGGYVAADERYGLTVVADTETGQLVYETPEIALIRVEDNTRRKSAGIYNGPSLVCYLFDKSGDVYKLVDPRKSLEELTETYSARPMTDDKTWLMKIEDKNGLQTCFDKLQIVVNNKDFKLTEPDEGPDWTHKDITWYGMYYDKDHKLLRKKIYFVSDLERVYITNDKNADDIVSWLGKYVPVTVD